MLETLFWISAAAILYTYLGYPIALWLLASARKLPIKKTSITPSVSVVIACHNEERNIDARIRNIVACDYPAEMVEIIVVSDGSTDRTVEIAQQQASERMKVFSYDRRRGKASALNLGVAHTTGEITLFADARQSFDSNVIKELVANFADPTVGAVSGELKLEGSGGASVGEGVGLYWKYEKWIRKSESRAGSVIGATGAIFAIRKELWRPLPEATILDDVYTPMQIALSGKRVVFEERAIAKDNAAESSAKEFTRKVRTLTGNYQLCQLMPRLLMPTSLLVLKFYSHKLMRLFAPIHFLLLFAASVMLINRPDVGIIYQAALVSQIAFYAGVLVAALFLKRNRRIPLLNFAYVFSLMNAAALVGLFYFVIRKRNVWAREH
jgi:poly-beta-1,6-N-acetyl-D-glucosamine synthase